MSGIRAKPWRSGQAPGFGPSSGSLVILRGVITTKNQPLRVRLGFAFQGLAFAMRSENSLKFQAGAFLAVVIALAILRPGPIWWALVPLASSAVLAVELFNTALEHLVDHLHPEVHPEIRIVKDCAAAAVLLSALGAVTVAVALAMHLLGRG